MKKPNILSKMSALFVALFVCGAMTAQNNYGIQIAGTELTSTNAGAINNNNFPNLGLASGGSITYDHSSKTFTLTNVQASVANSTFIQIIRGVGIPFTTYKINLVGSSNITASGGISAIYTENNLTIEGSGSLKLTAEGNSVGIYVRDGTLTIRNTRVEAIGKWGITGFTGRDGETLTIENSVVKATGKAGGSIMDFQTITLTGCDISQPAGAAVATNGTYGKAVMLNDSVVRSQVVIEPTRNYPLWVGGVQVSSANASNITGTGIAGTVSYNPDTKTLTLNNATITGAKVDDVGIDEYFAGIKAAGGEILTINLIGKNVINLNVPGDPNYNQIGRGIRVEGYVKFTGNDTLHIQQVRAQNALQESYTGIYADGVVIYGSTVMIAGSPIDNSIFVADELGSLALYDAATLDCKANIVLTEQPIVYAGAVLKEGDAEGSLGVVEQFTLSPWGQYYNRTKRFIRIKLVDYGIYIAGTKLTIENVGAINNRNFPGLGLAEGGSITYDHSTKTFTLTNVTANVTSSIFMNIWYSAENDDYTINLVGTNVITNEDSFIRLYQCNLIVTGEGSLKVTSTICFGFYIFYRGTLTIKNTTVEAIGSYGIIGNNGSIGEHLIIENSNVTATGADGSICDFQTITLTNCEITQPAGAINNGHAVTLNGEVVTSEVKISPTTGLSTLAAEGIYVWGEKGAISIEIPYFLKGESGANVAHIYNVSGVLVRTLPLQGTKEQVAVPAGIYIVKIGTAIEKVVVR